MAEIHANGKQLGLISSFRGQIQHPCSSFISDESLAVLLGVNFFSYPGSVDSFSFLAY